MYIPPSNIIETGYANSGMFNIAKRSIDNFLSANNPTQSQPYIGFYHKDKNNNYWTGKEHNDDSLLLEELSEAALFRSDFEEYNNLNPKILPTTTFAPDFIYPTETDYINGSFIRFVLKPVISSAPNDFIEVKIDKFKQVIQNSNLITLYKPVTFMWKLTGPLHDLYDENNVRIVSGIIDTNKRSIQDAERIVPNLSLYFTDLKQFGRPG